MRRALVLFTVGVGLLTACGGDDGATEASQPVGSEVETPTTGSVEVDTPETEAPDSPEVAGDDSCSVEVTGDKTARWTSPGGISALNTEYWLAADQADLFGEGFYFIINCPGDQGSVSFGSNASADESDIPFGPATYTLNPATNRFGGNPDDPIAVLFTLTDSETNWGVSEPGVLEITAFDDEHIAGRFEFTATDLLYDLGGSESEGTVRVTGSFNYRNPN